MKTSFRCFQNLKTETQWQYDNFIQLMRPTALSCHVMPVHPTALSFSNSLFFLFSFLSFYSPHLHSSFFLLHRVSTNHSVSSSSPSNLHCSSTNHQLPLPQATTTNLLVQAQPRIENPKIFHCHQLN